MKTIRLAAWVVLFVSVTSGRCFGQFRIPVRPPVRPPVPVPHIPVHHLGHSGNSNESDEWLYGSLGAIGLAVGGVLVWKMWRGRGRRSTPVATAGPPSEHPRQIAFIRIIATPPGDAPEEVRRAWVGLKLPLAPGETEARPVRPVEILSDGMTEPMEGYVVDARSAVKLLAAHAPHAAAWWRDNARHVLRSDRLVFASSAARPTLS